MMYDQLRSRTWAVSLAMTAGLAWSCGSNDPLDLPETPIAVAVVAGIAGIAVNEESAPVPGASIAAVVRDGGGNVVGSSPPSGAGEQGSFTRLLEVQEVAPFDGVVTISATAGDLSGQVEVPLRFGRHGDRENPPDTATVTVILR